MTGYEVHYRTGSSDEMSKPSSSTSTDITDLTNGPTYIISVEATSQHLSGESEEMTITLREFSNPHKSYLHIRTHKLYVP